MDLESFRRARGLSLEQLAPEIGLASKGYLSRIESGTARAPLRLALKVEVWSGGEVRAIELLDAGDAELLTRVIGFDRVREAHAELERAKLARVDALEPVA